MNRLERKTTATLLIAIFMISAFAVAPILASEVYEFQVQGTGTVERTDDLAHEGSYSIKQHVDAPLLAGDDARVLFNHYKTLNTITSVDFFAYLQESHGSSESYIGPYVTMTMDRDDNGIADAWLVQYSMTYTSLNEWHAGSFGDSTLVTVAADQMGGPPGNWFVQTPILLSALKTTLSDPEDTESKTWGECTILQVKVGLGTWVATTEECVTAFVDDVTITDTVSTVTYGFEPEGAITISANAKVPKIGITLSRINLPFGYVVLGKSTDPFEVIITSTSEVPMITVTAELLYDPAGFYAECLKMDRYLYTGMTLAEGASKDVDFWLEVPRDQSPGSHEGTLIFWAQEG